MPKLTPSVPESFRLGGDEPAIIIATAARAGFRRWVDVLLTERLVVAAKVVDSIGGGQVVAVLRAHPNRVAEIVESGGDEVREVIALPADCMP
ncbi:MAG: hypothetical protein J2P17_01060 [Mycobacterium sp.]|nr:hypothetical protein [Mycobacterium sp.]